MNIRRFLASIIALFIFIFVYESIMHGKLLMQLYLGTPTIWRSYNEMMANMYFNIIIMALLSVWITFIFTRFYKEGGSRNGFYFGVYLGILSGIQAAGAYYYLPISATLAVSWFLTYLVESVLGGLLIGAIYRQ